jgi:hypothetical protein
MAVAVFETPGVAYVIFRWLAPFAIRRRGSLAPRPGGSRRASGSIGDTYAHAPPHRGPAPGRASMDRGESSGRTSLFLGICATKIIAAPYWNLSASNARGGRIRPRDERACRKTHPSSRAARVTARRFAARTAACVRRRAAAIVSEASRIESPAMRGRRAIVDQHSGMRAVIAEPAA